MKLPPKAIPLVAQLMFPALIVLISGFLCSMQPFAQPQRNLQQPSPNVAAESTKETPDPQIDWNKTLDSLEKLTTILALTLGGIGAYYKFFKGRTFHPRLQPEVSGKIIEDGEVRCLLITMLVKNVGVSSIYFTKAGTRIDVYSYGSKNYQPTTHLAVWEFLDTFRIFTNHKWIESGEAIKDELLIAIAAERQVAFKIEMTVNCKGISFRSKAIIEWKSENDNLQRKDENYEQHR